MLFCLLDRVLSSVEATVFKIRSGFLSLPNLIV